MKKLTLATAVALLCTPMLVSAAKAVDPGDATIDNVARLNAIVNAGYGVNYKARINVDLNAYKYMNQIIFKTDDLISPAGAPIGEVLKVLAVPSMG